MKQTFREIKAILFKRISPIPKVRWLPQGEVVILLTYKHLHFVCKYIYIVVAVTDVVIFGAIITQILQPSYVNGRPVAFKSSAPDREC